MLTFITCISSISLANENINIVSQKETSSFYTQRIWLCVSNKSFLTPNSSLHFLAKKDLISDECSFEIQYQKNWDGGIFYFADIPLGFSMFRVSSCNNEETLCQTKWMYNILPSKLYEIWDESLIIRSRNADVHCPDAHVLSLVLSAYLSFESSYENGYSAFPDIQKTWLNYYSGATNGTLENTYLYDYGENDYLIKDQNPKKTVLKSVKEKIDEMEDSYNHMPHEKSIVSKKNCIIGLVFFFASILFSFGICFLFRRKLKNDKTNQ